MKRNFGSKIIIIAQTLSIFAVPLPLRKIQNNSFFVEFQHFTLQRFFLAQSSASNSAQCDHV